MYGGIIHPFSLTVGAADKTQRDVEINQLAFFFFFWHFQVCGLATQEIFEKT